MFNKDRQYYKFCLYGFFKNLRFFEQFLFLFFLEKGIAYLKIGLLYSIREITIILLEIPSGLIADAIGRRKTMIAAFGLYIISFLVFYFSRHFLLMAVAMFFFALGDAFRSGVHKAMIFHYLKETGQSEHKVDYYGHTRSWSQRGSALSALIAALVVFYSGNYRAIFIASVIPYLADMLLIWSYPAYLDGETKALETETLQKKFSFVFSIFLRSFKNFSMIRILTNLSLYGGFYKAVKDYIQPVIMTFALTVPLFTGVQEKKKTALFVGLFYFFVYLLTARMSLVSGRFLQLFKRKATIPMNITVVSGFITGVALGICYDTGYLFWSIVGFLMIMMFENLRKPIGIALVANETDKHIMASVLSVQSQATSLFAALLAPMVGFFADKFGIGQALLLVSLLLILMFPVYWLKAKQ